MPKPMSYLCRVSLIVFCALLAGVASADLANELNQEEDTNGPVNKGFLPSDFWTSREVKVRLRS